MDAHHLAGLSSPIEVYICEWFLSKCSFYVRIYAVCAPEWHVCVCAYTLRLYIYSCANDTCSERGALPIEQLAGVKPRAEQPEPGVHAWETGLAGHGS